MRIAATRRGKRAMTVYLQPGDWRSFKLLAFDLGVTANALGEQGIQDIVAKYSKRKARRNAH
ncbi:MAG: hypothetical protein JO188_18170 [Hyphomicrobiales bacterium]|nr:hypothetical protein [Hyphomicrobiales bacterium]